MAGEVEEYGGRETNNLFQQPFRRHEFYLSPKNSGYNRDGKVEKEIGARRARWTTRSAFSRAQGNILPRCWPSHAFMIKECSPLRNSSGQATTWFGRVHRGVGRRAKSPKYGRICPATSSTYAQKVIDCLKHCRRLLLFKSSNQRKSTL